MTMDRRTLLRNLGVAGTIGATAGCVGVQEQSTETQSGGNSGSSGSDGSDGSDDESTATSTGPAGEAEVWYTLAKAERPGRESVIETFNSESRHTITGSNISDMVKKTTSAIPVGEGPESFEWAHDKVGGYYQQGFLTDMSDQVDVDLGQFTSAAAEAVQYKGNVVGLPRSAETVGLVYNTDIVDEAPETVSEMVSVMEEFHDPDNGKYGMGYPVNAYFVSAWLQAFGGHYLDISADEPLGVNSDETVQGLQFLLDNFKPYMPKDPSYGPQAAAFADGNAAFAINGPWYLATLNEKGVNYEVAPLPSVEGGSPTPYTGIKVWYFAKKMREDDAATVAAKDFAEWFVTNEDHLLTLAQEQGHIPVLSSLVGSDELPDTVAAFSQAVEQGTPMPSDPKMAAVWPAIETAILESFNGNTDPQAALDTAAEEIRSNWE
ncbi:extracellular solute-binding protein [Halobaculum marinum]|uniref:Extracellular solute-binding protein n=1 Tax=Halobaculum marinum TaxID=3031996 RepID=A0ABD5WZ48_9EURY|nr:extracellular solute-binding protein [Halobaculum sp. DT55]